MSETPETDSLLDPDFAVQVALPAVPTTDSSDSASGGGLWQVFMPMIGMAGFSFIYLINPTPTSMLMGGAIVLSTLASGIGLALATRIRNDRRFRRKQLIHLSELDDNVERALRQLRDAYLVVLAANPHVQERVWALGAHVASPPRTPVRPDFLHVRLGEGPAPLGGLPEGDDPDSKRAELDPSCAEAHAAAMQLLRDVDGWPVQLPLLGGELLTIGTRAQTQQIARTLLLTACATHSPDSLRVLIVAGPDRRRDWEWTRWLPHRACQWGVADQTEAITALSDRLDPLETRHMVVIADDIEPGSPLDIALSSAQEAEPTLCVVRTAKVRAQGQRPAILLDSVTDDRVRVRIRERGIDAVVRGDNLDPSAAEAGARYLADRFPGHDWSVSHSASVLSPPTREALLRLLDGSPRWSTEMSGDFLVAALGGTDPGRSVTLDLKEPAAGGVGPHGVVVGATGSGKSELLRTLIVSLVSHHHTDDLALLLADFKGGATFIGIADLPHVTGVITNLELDLPLVVRAQMAMEGEARRRQEKLAEHGIGSISEYRAARHSHPEWEPMPHLLIVIDEFSELLEQEPGFIGTFASIGRLGRSLGLHLLLASQRLDEGRLRGLESHLSYRIALRTFNVSDSMAAIGSRDAYSLPSAPGSALIKTGGGTPTFFRTDYISSVFEPISEDAGGAVTVCLSDGFVLERPSQSAAPRAVVETRTPLEIAAELLPRAMPRAHQIWLPPLDSHISLARLVDGERDGAVSIPIAELDEPHKQRKSTVWLDLSSSASSVAITGAAQTGKTTLIQTIVVAAAAAYSPEQVGFVLFDAAGSLFSLRDLVHVCSYAPQEDTHSYHQAIQFVQSSMQYRAAAIRDHGLSGFADLRGRWATADWVAAGPADLFVVIDNFADHTRSNEDVENDIRDVLAKGPGLGIHVILTVRRWGELRIALNELIPTKIEFALNDVADSVYQRRNSFQLSPAQRGRALGSQGLMQVALPVLTDREVDSDSWPAAFTATRSRIAAAWADVPRPRHDEQRSPALSLSAVLHENRPAVGSPLIGVTASSGSQGPVVWDCFGGEPNLLVVGPEAAGKTNVIAILVSQLMASHSPEQLQFSVLDPRMKLAPVIRDEYRSGFASSSTRAADVVRALHEVLMGRMPAAGSLDQFFQGAGWSGRRDVLVIDDAHLLTRAPLAPLEELLPFAHALGLTILAATRDGEHLGGATARTLSGIGCTKLAVGTGGRSRRDTQRPGRAVLDRPGVGRADILIPLFDPSATTEMEKR